MQRVVTLVFGLMMAVQVVPQLRAQECYSWTEYSCADLAGPLGPDVICGGCFGGTIGDPCDKAQQTIYFDVAGGYNQTRWEAFGDMDGTASNAVLVGSYFCAKQQACGPCGEGSFGALICTDLGVFDFVASDWHVFGVCSDDEEEGETPEFP